MKKSPFLDFNKQIVVGEIGSLIGAPLAGTLCSLFTQNPNTISGFTVAGSLIGASLFWLITRILDEKRKKQFSTKKLFGDIAFYTPAAVTLVFLVYQPTLFFLTKTFLNSKMFVTLAVILSQIIAFMLFLVLINIYRIVIKKYFKREL